MRESDTLGNTKSGRVKKQAPPPPAPKPNRRTMKDKHTPGPWTAELREDSPTDYPGYPTRNLLITAKTREYQIDCNCAVDLANARLMAAAPELLKALKALVDGYASHEFPVLVEAAERAKILIAKIEGDE